MVAKSKSKIEFPHTNNEVPPMVDREERMFWIKGEKLRSLRVNSGLSLRMFAKELTDKTGLIEGEEKMIWVRGLKQSALRQSIGHSFLSVMAGHLESFTVALMPTTICSYIGHAPESSQTLGLRGFAVLQLKKSDARVVG